MYTFTQIEKHIHIDAQVINEIDLFPTFCTILPIQIDCLKQLSKFAKLAYVNVGLFWPFSNR